MPGSAKNPMPPLADLLISGGDTRIIPGEDGRNKYGCYPTAHPDVLSYSSSTASSISVASFTACEALYERIQGDVLTRSPVAVYAREMARVRATLLHECGLNDKDGLACIFAASGTDLHVIASQLCAAQGPLVAIMPDPAETGSGVEAALSGRHFSAVTSRGISVNVGCKIAGAHTTDIFKLSLHGADGGTLRDGHDMSDELERAVNEAHHTGRRILLLLCDTSKTGLIFPALADVLRLRKQYPQTLDVLVDACQFRLSRATLRAYLGEGFMVGLTGSKFVAGPAFGAALMIPENIARRLSSNSLPPALREYSLRGDWPESRPAATALADGANFGLLLRLEAALTHLRTFNALPEASLVPFITTFGHAVMQKLRSHPALALVPRPALRRTELNLSPSWDALPTIFPFSLRHPVSGAFFTHEASLQVYALLQRDVSHVPNLSPDTKTLASPCCLLGQPVRLGEHPMSPQSALRLCLDMSHIIDALSDPSREQAVIAGALCALDKANLLAEHFSLYCAS